MSENINFTLHFEEKGAGSPVLLIHGFPFSARLWAGQLEALSAEYHVLAPDLPGFGESPAMSASTNVDQYAEDCVALLDAMDILEPVHVGGLSMGGYIALAFARMFPERVASLLLLSTRAGADSPEGKTNRDKTIAQVVNEGPSAVTEAMFPKLLAPATYTQQPEVAKQLQAIMADASQEGILAALTAMRDRPDSTNLLRNLDMPALVIHGSEDQVIPPSEAENMADGLPNGKLHLIEGAGHLPNLEQPQEFNRLVAEFLAKQ